MGRWIPPPFLLLPTRSARGLSSVALVALPPWVMCDAQLTRTTAREKRWVRV